MHLKQTNGTHICTCWNAPKFYCNFSFSLIVLFILHNFRSNTCCGVNSKHVRMTNSGNFGIYAEYGIWYMVCALHPAE